MERLPMSVYEYPPGTRATIATDRSPELVTEQKFIIVKTENSSRSVPEVDALLKEGWVIKSFAGGTVPNMTNYVQSQFAILLERNSFQ